jgi:hypothetical protein
MQMIAWKFTLSTAGAMLGMKMTKDPAVIIGCGLAGLLVGHAIDLRCPQCGAILQVLTGIVE